MKCIYENHYWKIFWHEGGQIIHFVFSDQTEYMTVEQYYDMLGNFIPIIKEYKPKNILADTTHFRFTITPDVQEWINEHILSLYSEIGVKKHAVLLSSDLFTLVSVEQTMDDYQEGVFINHYFEDSQKALDWLLE